MINLPKETINIFCTICFTPHHVIHLNDRNTGDLRVSSLVVPLAQVIWSFVKLEYYPEELLDAVTLTLSSNSSKYDGKAVSNVLWALARRGPVPSTPAMLDSVALELGPRAKV